MASCSRSVALTRSLNSASFSPFSGRNPHWLRKSAVRFRYSAMSSIGMPLATRVPTKGGTNSWLSSATVGACRLALDRRRVADRAGCAWGRRRSEISRPKSGSSSPRALELDQPVHHPQPLEGVLAVEERPVVDLAQVALDVGAGQRGPAQEDRDGDSDRSFISTRFSRMISVDFTSSPLMPMASASVLLDRGDHLVDADLDAEVDDLVAVVGQDDVDEVLADVVDVALDRGEHDRALAALVRLLHVRLEEGDRRLHRLGRLQHEGQLHLAGGEQVADHLHARQQDVVDDVEGRDPTRAPRSGRPPGRCGSRR